MRRQTRAPRTSLRFLSFGRNLFEDQRRIVEHSQFEIAVRSKGMLLPIVSQGIGVS